VRRSRTGPGYLVSTAPRSSAFHHEMKSTTGPTSSRSPQEMLIRLVLLHLYCKRMDSLNANDTLRVLPSVVLDPRTGRTINRRFPFRSVVYFPDCIFSFQSRPRNDIIHLSTLFFGLFVLLFPDNVP